VNIIKSGKMWYGEVFSEQTSYEFNFTFPDIILDQPISFKASVAARSSENSNFTFYAEDELLLDEEISSVNINSAIYARTLTTNLVDFPPQDEDVTIRVDYYRPNMTATGWLNYIELNAMADLNFRGGQMAFRNSASVGDSNTAHYEIDGVISGADIWDVSDKFNARKVVFDEVDHKAVFDYPGDTLCEFIIHDGTGMYEILIEGKVTNQNLHSMNPPDFMIITHESFIDEAERLADHHRGFDGMSVSIVTPGEIYNEFSSGAQDVAAIRDFLKMLYDRSTEFYGLRYVLFFGDASYDYLDRVSENTNMVPTYQSNESLKLASSFVTDDFFACMDLNEGSNSAGNPDIGTGRFPVITIDEARDAVDKVIAYATRSKEVMGIWRNKIGFVADDGGNQQYPSETG